MAYPGTVGYTNTNFSQPLTGFPSSINLGTGASGVVMASAVLSAAPATGVIVGMPELVITYGIGGTQAGTGIYNLQNGVNYSNMTLNGTLQFYCSSAVSAGSVSLSIWAILLGQTRT